MNPFGWGTETLGWAGDLLQCTDTLPYIMSNMSMELEPTVVVGWLSSCTCIVFSNTTALLRRLWATVMVGIGGKEA